MIRTSHSVLRKEHFRVLSIPVRFFRNGDSWSRKKVPTNYGVAIVPQQKAWVVERLGRFHRILEPGLRFLVPVVERIAYVHSLKEEAISIPNQTAITMDNVTIDIDGVLYIRVTDPNKASYGVEDVHFAVIQLAQTTMRSELGKITLDKTFAERESLNKNIVESINSAAEAWGIQCLRYEIRDIAPPTSVKIAMDMQAEAERRKRATILDSEGQRQSEINRAEGLKMLTVLQAEGDAEALVMRAEASAQGICTIAESVSKRGGQEAVSLKVAEQYMTAFGNLAKEGTTMLLPTDTANPANMVAQAMGIYKTITATTGDVSKKGDNLAEDEPAQASANNENGDGYLEEDDSPESTEALKL